MKTIGQIIVVTVVVAIAVVGAAIRWGEFAHVYLHDDRDRDLQVLVADRALLAARALGDPGARDLTAAEVADARERCARRPEYAELCMQIEERLQRGANK